MKKKTAVVFGTFAPHQGHIGHSRRAKRQSGNQVWVVVSGYEETEESFKSSKRFRYIRGFRDDELTSVCKLDETTPRCLAGRSGWTDVSRKFPMMKPSKN